jgi:hypothetical protein
MRRVKWSNSTNSLRRSAMQAADISPEEATTVDASQPNSEGAGVR